MGIRRLLGFLPRGRQGSDPPRRSFWYRRTVWAFIIFVIIVVVVATPVAVTQTRGKSKQNTAPTSATGPVTVTSTVAAPTATSSIGAIPGTGMVALDLADGTSTKQFYYQAPNNAIHFARYTSDLGWTYSSEVVATDARPGTAITGLSFVYLGEVTWHVFYFDNHDILQEAVHSNKTAVWSRGTLGDSNFKAASSRNAGLTACRDLNWYGQAGSTMSGGIRLFYGAADGKTHLIHFYNGATAWDPDYTFQGTNGFGGVECTVRGKSVTTAWLLNTQNQVEEWWYEFNSSVRISNHPDSTWVKGSTYPDPKYNTTISVITSELTGNRYVHFQDANGTVYELVNSGLAENATWGSISSVTKAMPETKIACVLDEDTKQMHVYVQLTGNDITEFVRGVDADGFESNSWSDGKPFNFGSTGS